MPIGAAEVYLASGADQALRELLSAFDGIIKVQDMPAADITEGLNVPDLHQNGPVRVPAHGQPGFEDHVGPGLEHGNFLEGFIVLGGPLSDEHRVVHVVEAESEDEVRATLARDPWSETHLVVGAVEPWTIRLDGRPA